MGAGGDIALTRGPAEATSQQVKDASGDIVDFRLSQALILESLANILFELRKLNVQLSIITDTEVPEGDIPK